MKTSGWPVVLNGGHFRPYSRTTCRMKGGKTHAERPCSAMRNTAFWHVKHCLLQDALLTAPTQAARPCHAHGGLVPYRMRPPDMAVCLFLLTKPLAALRPRRAQGCGRCCCRGLRSCRSPSATSRRSRRSVCTRSCYTCLWCIRSRSCRLSSLPWGKSVRGRAPRRGR